MHEALNNQCMGPQAPTACSQSAVNVSDASFGAQLLQPRCCPNTKKKKYIVNRTILSNKLHCPQKAPTPPAAVTAVLQVCCCHGIPPPHNGLIRKPNLMNCPDPGCRGGAPTPPAPQETRKKKISWCRIHFLHLLLVVRFFFLAI